MIGQIRGILLEKQPPQLLIEVNGVGYEIDAPMSTFYQLPEKPLESAGFYYIVAFPLRKLSKAHQALVLDKSNYKENMLDNEISRYRIIDAVRDIQASILLDITNNNKYRMLASLSEDAAEIYRIFNIKQGLRAPLKIQFFRFVILSAAKNLLINQRKTRSFTSFRMTKEQFLEAPLTVMAVA